MNKRKETGWRRRTYATTLRLVGAFGAILALFGAALLVTLATLHRIGQAEDEVARLDHAKHAGHLAAAQVREQYIHQAHTIINWDRSHLDHYDAVVRATRESTAHLRELARAPAEKERAEEIARLAEQNDADFRKTILAALARDDRTGVRGFHDAMESEVNRVVALNDELNGMFEAGSAAARTRAERLRTQARVVVLLCFGLAIAIAAAVGFLLMRSILKPVSALRKGAQRVGAGDLSARIQVRGTDEFAELAASFNQMAEDLARHQAELVRSQKLASIGQVAAGVAHEINNPLGVLLGYVKLLRRDQGRAMSEELKIIEDEALQCQRIVQGLLDLARSPRRETEAVDLVDLARDAVERLRESGKLDGVRVEAPAATVQALARGDEAKLRQVILNLVLNAVEAAAGAGRPDGRVTLSATTHAGEAVLEVADTGPGMTPEVRARAFDPFFTTKPKGTGLGLAIAHAIVDAHDGRIEIDSEPEQGTRVSLRLPAADTREIERS